MNRVKEYRKAKGITQEELGIRCGTTKSYICEIERNGKTPNVYLAQKLAKELRVSVAKLFPLEVE